MTQQESSPLPRALAHFCRLLRDDGGISTSTAQLIAFQSALSLLDKPDLEDLYWVGTSCLGIRRHERPIYDRLFGDFWLGGAADAHAEQLPAAEPPQDGVAASGQEAAPGSMDATGHDDRDGDQPHEPAGSEASATEVLRLTPFDACSEEEQALLRAMIRRLRIRPPRRMSRRWASTARRRQLDLRRTFRASLATHGALMEPRWRYRRTQPRRIVMFLDVSRSMAAYSRLLLHFAHAIAVSGNDVEVICFGTRVTRVTRLIRRQRSSRALEAAAAAVLDWDGGTRIGEAIRIAQTMGTVKGALRGSVVLMMSDGLEQDDPKSLARTLRRLRRTCHSLVWANPLAGDPQYEPLTAGMLAALPYIDVLCPGDTLTALERIAETLGELEDVDRPHRPGRSTPSQQVWPRIVS